MPCNMMHLQPCIGGRALSAARAFAHIWMAALFVGLLVLSGCDRRRKVIEQFQAEISRCDRELQDIMADDDWRLERDEIVSSLSLEKQSPETQEEICKTLRRELLSKYSSIESEIGESLVKMLSNENSEEMIKFFLVKPALDTEMITHEVQARIEKSLGCKNLYEIVTMLEEEYPMYEVTNSAKHIKGDMVTFTKTNGAGRKVSGILNVVTPNGAKFGSTFCPFIDMPEEVVARIRLDVRKDFFRKKSGLILKEQNAMVKKMMRQELLWSLVEYGYLPVVSSQTGDLDLADAANWKPRRQFLKEAYRSTFAALMKDKGYEYGELPDADTKEWIPSQLLDDIESLQSQRKTAADNLNNFLRRKR